MQASYSLNSSELNINFLNSIKEMFQNKNIEIIITDHTDNEVNEYRKSISNRLEQYKSNPESFTELTDEFWVDTEKRLIERHQKRAV
ncbi:hypothetical protein FCU45_01380 [Sulfurimonas crateris]|uniref:Uncharacterized protein n=1 Tax=Sulfurimonas crateris TaxID=2574727 RepID=A0A4U2ZBM4_9BACT|nr:hypothetical protein [Sulfurimonas crateris]TKI71062.1 hypothetical protein FCU45_01380 [Sulfurimonas crateris]